MCRIAGYLGPARPLASILTEPPHSLRAQARHPNELSPGLIGSDGYGFGWVSASAKAPGRYRQTLPIWSDPNLDAMAPQITSACFVASTRTMVPGMPVSFTNTPPFCFGETLVVHNGSIEPFQGELSDRIRSTLRPSTRAALQGNTDSEYLAAALHDIQGDDLAARVRTLLERVHQWLDGDQDSKAQLNLIAVHAGQLVAVRYALRSDFPSLYYNEASDGGTVVISEPLCDDLTWVRMAERTMLAVSRQGERVCSVL